MIAISGFDRNWYLSKLVISAHFLENDLAAKKKKVMVVGFSLMPFSVYDIFSFHSAINIEIVNRSL